MTITISGLDGTFEYPPTTLGHLIKKKWNPTSVGETDPPTFIIPITNTESKDPWFMGQAPEILFRHTGNNLDREIAIGNTLFRKEFQIEIHISCITQKQEFKYQKHIDDLIKENRNAPIYKYSEEDLLAVPTPIPAGKSGWLLIMETGVNWHNAPDGDPEEVGDITTTHSFGSVRAVWFEHKS